CCRCRSCAGPRMAEPTASRRSAVRLARLSFRDGERAATLLSGPPLSWWDDKATMPVDEQAAAVIAAIGRTADPDAALIAVSELAATAEGAAVRSALTERAEVRARLLPLLAVSAPLA